MPKVKSITGEHEGKSFVIESDPLLIGRRDNCTISLTHEKVSRSHAEIGVKNKQVYVRDLKSSNGTFVNGIRLDPSVARVLRAGDEIRVGGTILRYFDRDLQVPDVEIAGHELIEPLAQGGMGAIFRAKQVSMDREVAVKILNPEYAKRPEFVNRFIQEARSAGKLNHPNIIHVHTVGKAGEDCYYFTMEMVNGRNLTQAMADRDRLSVKEVLRVCARVADALEYAHQRGLVHRDIKPDNIMVCDNGDVKLADLGIAKSFDISGTGEDDKRVLGTPHYMSPEQASNKLVDGRSDLYSLGATLYHILSGEPVFDAPRSREVMVMHVRQTPRALCTVVPELPKEIGQLVDKLLSKDPGERFQTAAEVRDALDALVASLEKKPPSKQGGKPKTMRPARGKTPGARPRAKTGSFDRAPEKSKMPIIAVVIIGVLLVGAYLAFSGKKEVVVEQGPTAAELLADAGELEDSQKWDDAIKAYKRVMAKFPKDAETRKKAKEQIELIRETQKTLAREAEVKEAWEEYLKKKPDLASSVATHTLETLKRKYPELADKVAGELTELKVEAKAEDALGDLRNQVAALIGGRKFDDALAAVNTFAQTDAGADAQSDLNAIRTQIQEAARVRVEKARRMADEYVQKNQYGAALATYAALRKDVQFAQMNSVITSQESAIRRTLTTQLDRIRKAVQNAMLEMDYAKAKDTLSNETQRFAGTGMQSEIDTLKTTVDELENLHDRVIIAMARQKKPWVLPPEFELPDLDNKKQRVIVGASKKGVRVSLGGEITTIVGWDKLTIRHVLQIYDHYVPPQAESARKAMAQLQALLES